MLCLGATAEKTLDGEREEATLFNGSLFTAYKWRIRTMCLYTIHFTLLEK